VTRDGSVALVAGDIKSGEVVVVVYDGTRFQVVSQLNSAGNATFANVSITSALNVGGVVTLSGGTANGVLFLNGSKVATSGSALTFDGSTQFTVNGSTTSTALSVKNTVSETSLQSISTDGYINMTGTGGTIFRLGAGYTEGMRLTSTGLGIGTSTPAYKLTVQSAIDTYAFNIRDTIGNERVLIGSRSTAPIDNITPVQMGNDNTGNLFLSSRTNTACGINFYTNAGTAASLRATIDSSGNLLVGATAAVSARNEFRLGGNGSGSLITMGRSGTNKLNIGVDSTDNVDIENTANTPIRIYTNSTERCRITSGGEFYINTTASSYGTAQARMDVNGGSTAAMVVTTSSGASYANIYIHNTATSGNNVFVDFGTEGTWTSRGSINYNRAGGLTVYNTTSDYRAKDILGPVQNSGATIDALKVYEGQMKGATQSRPMLVAHEAQEHAPYAVTGEKDAVNKDGTPKYQQMDVSALVPLLLAEIQSLRARVAQLETK